MEYDKNEQNRRLLAEKLMNEVYKLCKDTGFSIIAKGCEVAIMDDLENKIYRIKYIKK